MKIMAIVERHSVPLAVSTHAANHHEATLVQLSFDFYMIEAKPENLIGDRAYDSDKLNEELRPDGIEMISPHRRNRKKPMKKNGRRPGDIAECYADTKYAKEAMGWMAEFGLERMCRDSWRWEKT